MRNSERKYPAKLRTGPANKGINVANKLQRKSDAIERQAAYNSLTTEEKIFKLDKKLGIGLGAAKQRDRLFNELAKFSPDDATIAEAGNGF